MEDPPLERTGFTEIEVVDSDGDGSFLSLVEGDVPAEGIECMESTGEGEAAIVVRGNRIQVRES